jgi:choline dehydrogenase
MNGYRQEGFGPMDRTTYRGRRWSAADGVPAAGDDATQSADRAAVPRHPRAVRGPRAVGVEYVHNGQLVKMRSRREVIVSGGAINSPQILLLSGVGDAEALRKLDIDVVADVPGVGANLQDHLETYVQHACTQPITLYSTQSLIAMGAIGLEWLLLRKGLGATNHFESGGFIRSRAGVEHPICNTISCRSRSATTARTRSASTASRRTSVRCGQPRGAASP